MTGRAASWAVGAAVSAVAHVGFGAALMAALQPQEIPDQPKPKSALTVTPEVVDRSEAAAQTPESDSADQQNADSTALGAGAVATSRAEPQAPPSSAADPAQVPADPVASALSSEPTLPRPSTPEPSRAEAPEAPRQAPQLPDTATAAALRPSSDQTSASLPPSAASQEAQPSVAAAAAQRPEAAVAAPSIPQAASAPTVAPPTATATSTLAPEVARPATVAPSASLAAANLPAGAVAVADTPQTDLAIASAPATTPAAASSPPVAATQTAAPPLLTAALAAEPNVATATTSPLPQAPTQGAAVPADQQPADALALPSKQQAPSAPLADLQAAAVPQGATAAPAEPETTSTKAVLAFPDAGSGAIDPASIAAFQSFTQPQTDGTDPVRDNLEAALSLPCARMQVSFDPLTTRLSVQGHVPRADQRGPVIAALQAQMGGDIEVADNLLVLPAPQCGALSGIASVGLPQSTDQITNPLIVGQDTHARSFRYIKDDPLVLDLTAPDYPAYVYVDYFDADGNVIHLSPNARAPLTATTPKEQLQIGARRADEPGLMVIIGPPYGQEIAVAFAASVPLYQEERPLVEPAEAYLSWLQEQVTKARASHPDFKGEWVYFFVQTAAE